jgi:phosphatidylethanolamine/phosphatidyl-N-methylethanolamine N-methyltransferase
MTMDLASVRRAYHRQAPYYDIVFGTLLGRGRRQAIALANSLGKTTLLEVGVGTGLSLPFYRPAMRITGIDVSSHMLDRARKRVINRGLGNIDGLFEMDAEALEFADNSYQVVVAMFVASVVPNPDKLVSEMQRVCEPGGDILIVNHFAQEEGLRGLTERRLARWSRHLGWRPDFSLDILLDTGSLDIVERRNTDPFGMFTLLHFRNGKEVAEAAE